MATLRLYAATTNPGKLREFARSGSSAGIEVMELPGLRSMPEPVEDAPTFTGNASLKAGAYSRLAPGLLVLADDSGLEVDALGGEPGVRSARFAEDAGYVPPQSGNGAAVPAALDARTKDGRNNLLLLERLARAGAETRLARFRCALAVARDGVALYAADGSVEGLLLDAPRGSNGFGYDPLFFVPELGRTAAELTDEEKWQISHRGRAFRRLLGPLRADVPVS